MIGKHSTNKHLKTIGDIKEKYRHNEAADDLAKRIDESQQKHGKYFDSWELTRKSSIEHINDPALKKEARAYLAKMKKETKPILNKIMKNHGLMALGSIGVFIAATIFEAKLQTDSSKIARYQARKELDDPKAFVNYTPEQIAAAQKELKEHPELKKEEKKSKLKSGMIASIYNILRDRGSYLKDKSATTDDSKKVTRALSHEEVLQAQKDKEVIQRSVRKINNEAEKYSENMEVAANVIMGATPILGATVGALVSWIMTKSGVTDRFVDKTVAKYGSKEAKTALESYRGIKKPDFFSRQWGKFAEELFYDRKNRIKYVNEVEDVAVEVSKAAKKSKKNLFTENTRKFFAAALAHKSGRNWVLGIAGGFITGFAGMLMALKLQKSSARAGRYTAKRELEKDPKNFIGYSEEDFAEVKDVKNNKKKPSTIREYALFIPTVIKQYWAYNKYRKNEYKEKQALNGLLRKQEVSETQLKDAKNLQRKLFNTFEKVDDNSQIYSESMEAATEIAQPFVWYGGMLAAFSPLIYGAVQLGRGKITPSKALQKIVDKFSSG